MTMVSATAAELVVAEPVVAVAVPDEELPDEELPDDEQPASSRAEAARVTVRRRIGASKGYDEELSVSDLGHRRERAAYDSPQRCELSPDWRSRALSPLV
jgi:hypothetical protein